jgi:hypothetical protein
VFPPPPTAAESQASLPAWPEIITGGGVTCAAPRSPKSTSAAPKKQLRPAVRELMGDVMLLGAGMRPLASVNSTLQSGDLVKARGAERENVQSSDPTSEALPVRAAGYSRVNLWKPRLAPTCFLSMRLA